MPAIVKTFDFPQVLDSGVSRGRIGMMLVVEVFSSGNRSLCSLPLPSFWTPMPAVLAGESGSREGREGGQGEMEGNKVNRLAFGV
jgi:hypothetical protein